MPLKTSDHLCECGCGDFTKIARDTIPRYGYVRGQPMRFLAGHYQRSHPPEKPRPCACGCGQLTSVEKGKAKRFVHGHNSEIRTLSKGDYVVTDLGYRTPCWVWKHAKGNRSGHGKVTVRKKKTWAHRSMYEQLVGPIPDGLVLDHLCMNPSCVNPDHLEPVTQAENARRWHRSNTRGIAV